MTTPCFLCLDETKDVKKYMSVNCVCAIYSHTECWLSYSERTTPLICPYCKVVFESQKNNSNDLSCCNFDDWYCCLTCLSSIICLIFTCDTN